MADAVLADAGQFAVPLPRPAPQIRELLAAQGPVLDQVQTPVLVHFDSIYATATSWWTWARERRASAA